MHNLFKWLMSSLANLLGSGEVSVHRRFPKLLPSSLLSQPVCSSSTYFYEGRHLEPSIPCGIVEPLITFFLFRCIGGGEGLWIDPPQLLDPRFRRVPLELSCVKFEFRIMFILRCRFPCRTGRACSLVLWMNIRRVACR